MVHNELSTTVARTSGICLVRLGTIQSFVAAVAALCVLTTAASTAAAQDHDHHAPDEPTQADEHQHVMPPASSGAWTWSTDANVFFGYNYQQRLFADFSAIESQNWAMVSGERPVGAGRLTLEGMFSLEPWTIGRLVYGANGLFDAQRVYAFTASGQRVPVGGSPQAFQTGESYLESPLINYQHPHDLFMALGATYRVDAGRAKYLFAADLVGAPALGPTPFMHRESARDNPTVPLTHHYMDATHITTGVLTSGAQVGAFAIEASVFRGEEPDENRTNIDTPRLDSWSVRGSWRRGPWEAQISTGRLAKPEWFEPVDVMRTTASIAFNGELASRPLAVTAAWGHNRDIGLFGLDGYLLEWDWRVSRRNTFYGRGESMLKEIFGLGVHPAGLLNHPRNFSHIDALTLGYVREIPVPGLDRFGIGADITVHRTSADLVEFYGSPKSYHVFLRWRPGVSPAAAHVHH